MDIFFHNLLCSPKMWFLNISALFALYHTLFHMCLHSIGFVTDIIIKVMCFMSYSFFSFYKNPEKNGALKICRLSSLQHGWYTHTLTKKIFKNQIYRCIWNMKTHLGHWLILNRKIYRCIYLLLVSWRYCVCDQRGLTMKRNGIQ